MAGVLNILLGRASAASSGPLVSSYKAFNAPGTFSSPNTVSIDIGTASSDRYVVIGFTGLRNGAGSISSITANGTSLTQIVSAVDPAKWTSELWGGIVTTGSGAQNVVVTFTGSFYSFAVASMTITGSAAVSVSATSTDTDVSNPQTASLNCAAGGCVIGVYGNNSGSSQSWTGLTMRVDTVDVGGRRFEMASSDFATAQTPLSVSIPGTSVCSLAVAAFTP